MFQTEPAKLLSKRFSANGTINLADLRNWSRAVLGSSGLRLKIAQADKGHYGERVLVKNEAAGFGSVWRDNAFGSTNDTMLIAPRDEVMLECVDLQSSGTYRWDAVNRPRPTEVIKVSPTLTWTGTAPTVTSNYMWYALVKSGQAEGLFFHGRIVISDGNGATDLDIVLPASIIPEKMTITVPIDMRVLVDTTWTDSLGYFNLDTSTGATRAKIQQIGCPTLTDTKACKFLYSGFVPISGWDTFTPEFTYGVGTATFAEIGYMMRLGPNTAAVVVQTKTSDSNAESAVTLAPPLRPPDMNVLGAAKAMELAGAGGATWSNCIPYIDLTDATAENRAIKNYVLTQATDAQAFAWSCAAIIPVRNWQSFTMSNTYGTATPEGTLVESGHFDAFDCMVFLNGYISFTDGNASTGVTIKGLPVPPRKDCAEIAIPTTETQHTDTFVNAMAFFDSDDADPDDRAVEEHKHTTWDDTEAGKLMVTGFYFV